MLSPRVCGSASLDDCFSALTSKSSRLGSNSWSLCDRLCSRSFCRRGTSTFPTMFLFRWSIKISAWFIRCQNHWSAGTSVSSPSVYAWVRMRQIEVQPVSQRKGPVFIDGELHSKAARSFCCGSRSDNSCTRPNLCQLEPSLLKHTRRTMQLSCCLPEAECSHVRVAAHRSWKGRVPHGYIKVPKRS